MTQQKSSDAKKPQWRKRAATALLAAAFGAGAVIPQNNSEAGCCGETVVLVAILAAMEANFALLYAYMISGAGDVGTGIVGTITGNAQARMSHAENTTANNDAHAQQQKQKFDADMAVAARVANEIPDERDCDEIPLVMGARGVGSEAAVAAAKKAAAYNQSVSKHAGGSQPSEAAHAGVVYSELTTYASQTDIDAGRVPAGSTSDYPDANVRVQSLFVPAHKYDNASEAAKVNLTFDANQQKAAELAQANIVARFSPPALPKNVENSPAGRMYVSKTKIYNARLSPAVHALSGIAARRTENQLTGAAQDAWTTISGRWDAVFPGVTQPTKPSEIEALRFEVMRRYADAGAGSWYQERIAKTSDPAAIAKELAVTDSVKLKLLFEIHQRMEEGSAIQAAILAQLVNPTSKSELDSAAQGAYRNKQ